MISRVNFIIDENQIIISRLIGVFKVCINTSQSTSQRFFSFTAAATKSRLQMILSGWTDENVTSRSVLVLVVTQVRLDGLDTSQVNVQDANFTSRLDAFDGSKGSAVPVTTEIRVFQKGICSDHFLELRDTNEIVINSVILTSSRCSSRI